MDVFKPEVGRIYTVNGIDGDMSGEPEESDVLIHLDTAPPQSVEALITSTNRGFAGKVIAIAMIDGVFYSKLNVLDKHPYKGKLTIDREEPQSTNINLEKQ